MAKKKAEPWARQHCSNTEARIGAVYVYVLWCPVSRRVVYVGCAVYQPSWRLLGHVCEARSKAGAHRPKSLWIRSLLDKGLYPTLRVVASCETWEEAYIKEVELIASIGARRPLLNGNRGNVAKAAYWSEVFKNQAAA